jgi:hypothetical protein
MNALHEAYECRCEHPHPQIVKGEDSGLCQGCGLIYDPRLYETRLRQHVKGWDYDSLDAYLREVDSNYRQLVATQSTA